ncbi:MAG: MotA/TolQ/ExbB proton channel family protein [Pseudomonadota bacterium]
MRTAILSVCVIAAASLTANVSAQEPKSLAELYELVKQGQVRDRSDNRKREQEFIQNKQERANLLTKAKQTRDAEERRSQQLEQQFQNNEITIGQKQDALKVRLGSLKELFGVLQQVSGDTRGTFEGSMTNVQFPNRSNFLEALAKKMGSETQLAEIEEIEQLWAEIMREMIETGKVVRFDAKVINTDGQETVRKVTRIGAFNVISEGKYLNFDLETQNLSELPRQPQARFTNSASGLESASSGLSIFGVDPTRGTLLSLLVQEATLEERIHQGGLPGYVIIGVGIFGLFLGLWRLIVLWIVGMRVNSQTRNLDNPSKGNPLGRVLAVYQENKSVENEALELKLNEAILKEQPKLEFGIPFIKFIAAVAPLMGLLGTVTGMILTFQAITLFGTGDPKMMAGGISQALITTVLGLVVAIPTLLMHTIVNSRSKRVQHILEEQSAGMIAEHKEAEGGVSA